MTIDLFGDRPEKQSEVRKPHTLHRKNAPETSVVAAHSVNVTKREQDVLDIITACEHKGITLTEISERHGRGTKSNIPYGTLNARPSGLEKKGKIFYLGDIRDGSRVMRASIYKTGNEPQ